MDALTTAHAATDKALDAMEKYVRSIYLRSVREIYKSWQKFFEQERKEIDKLQEDYEKAKKSGDKTLVKKAGIALAREKKKETIQSKWFHNAVKQTAENLLHVNETAVEYLNGRLPETYVTNFNAVGELCESAVTGYSYHIVDENTIRELAMSSDTSLLPYKEIDPAKDIAWNVRQMKSEVLQGILQGENMNTIAKRLSNVIGMNENSAVRNARTMVTAAENKGRQDGFYQAEEDGIILEKYWLCVHGERTREAHAAAGNDYSKSKSIPQSQPFIVGGEKLMFPGDNSMGASGWNLYNCRCSVAAVVKGFKKAQVQKAMAEKQVEATQPQGWESLPDNVTDRATAIDKLLTEETGKKSVFNGKVVIDDSIKFNGTANYDGSITLRSKASIKTEIHELLHQHSEGGQNRVYVSIFKNIEEGSVELLAQEICHAKGIKIGQFDYSYTPYVDALRQINKLSGEYKTDYDFAKALFGKPLEKRAEFLKSLGDNVAKDEKRFFRGALKTLGVK